MREVSIKVIFKTVENGCECKVQPNQDMHRNQNRNHLITPRIIVKNHN